MDQRLLVILRKVWVYVQNNPDVAQEVYKELTFYEKFRNIPPAHISRGVSSETSTNARESQPQRLRQQDLADQLGIDQSTVSRHLKKIRNALNDFDGAQS